MKSHTYTHTHTATHPLNERDKHTQPFVTDANSVRREAHLVSPHVRHLHDACMSHLSGQFNAAVGHTSSFSPSPQGRLKHPSQHPSQRQPGCRQGHPRHTNKKVCKHTHTHTQRNVIFFVQNCCCASSHDRTGRLGEETAEQQQRSKLNQHMEIHSSVTKQKNTSCRSGAVYYHKINTMLFPEQFLFVLIV